MRPLAYTLSVIFHPLLIATYGCLLLFFGMPNTIFGQFTGGALKWRITVMVFLFSFLLPAINIGILYRLRRIPSLSLSNKDDRTVPYLVTGCIYLALVYLLKDVRIWNSLKMFLFGGGVAILIVAAINTRYKISAHMTGLGGLLGALFCIAHFVNSDLTAWYAVVIVVSGFVGFARLQLREHTPAQVYLGFLLGVLVQCTTFVAAGKYFVS